MSILNKEIKNAKIKTLIKDNTGFLEFEIKKLDYKNLNCSSSDIILLDKSNLLISGRGEIYG